MKTDEAREFTRGQARRLHLPQRHRCPRRQRLDRRARPSRPSTDCIDELAELVQFCVNKLNAAKVWVTADHGFLFQQEAPDDTDKSKLSAQAGARA